MAEPTLKDVLAAVAQMRSEIAGMRSDMTERFEKIEADVNAHRAETAAGFARLERELEAHADSAHRDLDEDVAAIHKGLVRAKVPGIPKDRPSQVRAKGERPNKPVKKRRAR